MLLSACEPALEPADHFRVASQGLISADLSPNGLKLAIGSFNHGGSLWSIQDQSRDFNWNQPGEDYSAFRLIRFSGDGQQVASADKLALWDAKSGQSLRYWQAPHRILDLAISANGTFALLALENNRAVMFNLSRGGIIGYLDHKASVSQVAIDRDATLAVTGTVDGDLTFWSLENGTITYQQNFPRPVSFLALSPDGKLCVAGFYQGEVLLWNLKTHRPLTTLYTQSPGLASAAFNAAGTRLLMGTAREYVELWSLSPAERQARWKIPGDGPWHRAAAVAVGFTGDGRYLAAASDGMLYTLKQEGQK
ncbi:MAG: hypothetical protein KDI36_18865 [Pseudomonadales bacterium]|nr:hypothetical protein [Pseudomonadales bacterium]